jgi:hypothetical protein
MVIEPFELDGLVRASGFILFTVVNVYARHRKHISHILCPHLTCQHSVAFQHNKSDGSAGSQSHITHPSALRGNGWFQLNTKPA